jgi:hypothetical protein
MMNATADAPPRLRSALACAWPAMVLAGLLLAPFLNTPFTIDDPLYLREAQHVLTDPLHPQAFKMVWNFENWRPVSEILPGGVFVPYVLVPTALAGCKDWVGHVTELALLLAALWVSALAALRLGLDRQQARLVALLTATCPAVLGMAGTVMPDIEAMLLAMLGMERVLCWRDRRKWHQALAATGWLTLAALTRAHTIVILGAAAVLLLDGITREALRASFKVFPMRFLPVVLTPIAFLAVSTALADPNSEGENLLAIMLRLPGSAHAFIQNGCAFLAHWLLVVPLTIPWLVLRFRRIPPMLVSLALLAASVASVRLGWVAFAAAATLVVLADIVWDALQRRDRIQLALWLWLSLAVPVVIYVHLPSKYLLPSVPAAAMLVVRLIPEARPATARWLIRAVVTAGTVLGLLILLGIRDLAETQRRAVAELIEPRTKLGEHVWFAGHWGFQWYAEEAGASPVTLEPPLPEAGETIVVSEIDFAYIARTWAHRQVVRHFCYASSRIGRVMDSQGGAGFFSNPFGYLPWVWGSGEPSCFEVWKAE